MTACEYTVLVGLRI